MIKLNKKRKTKNKNEEKPKQEIKEKKDYNEVKIENLFISMDNHKNVARG